MTKATKALIVAGLCCLNAGLSYLNVYKRFELTDLDNRMTSAETRRSTEIVLVTIGEKDYEQVFQRRSPLNQKRVEQLIEAILSAQPKVLGVDLDSEDWRHPGPAAIDARIVWAQDGTSDDADLRQRVRLKPIAGPRGALAMALPDIDGVVRRHTRAIQLESGAWAWTLPGALLHANPPTADDAEESQLIRFTGRQHDFPRLGASAVMEAAGRCWEGDTACQPAKPSEALAASLRGKYVLLGGTYSAARDRFPTPAGVKDGVEILAHALESERSGFIYEVHPLAGLLIDIAMSLALFFLMDRYKDPFYLVLLISALGGLALSFFWSKLLFASWGAFTSFFPAVGAAILGIIIDLVKELEQTKRELAKFTNPPT